MRRHAQSAKLFVAGAGWRNDVRACRRHRELVVGVETVNRIGG